MKCTFPSFFIIANQNLNQCSDMFASLPHEWIQQIALKVILEETLYRLASRVTLVKER